MEDKPIMVNLLAVDESVRKAYEKSCQGDWSALDVTDILKELGAYHLEWAIRETLLRTLVDSKKVREMDVHEWFKKNCENILGDLYRPVAKKNCAKYQPDVWVMKKEKLIPVECKLTDFNHIALTQLLKYMEHYGADEGIAVAKNLCCELPPNITFVKHEVA